MDTIQHEIRTTVAYSEQNDLVLLTVDKATHVLTPEEARHIAAMLIVAAEKAS